MFGRKEKRLQRQVERHEDFLRNLMAKLDEQVDWADKHGQLHLKYQDTDFVTLANDRRDWFREIAKGIGYYLRTGGSPDWFLPYAGPGPDPASITTEMVEKALAAAKEHEKYAGITTTCPSRVGSSMLGGKSNES